MLRQHVDFIAVLLIAIALLAFSHVSSLRVPELGDSIRMQNALMNIHPCPTTREVLAHLGFN